MPALQVGLNSGSYACQADLSHLNNVFLEIHTLLDFYALISACVFSVRGF
jgi:hypothetical protein